MINIVIPGSSIIIKVFRNNLLLMLFLLCSFCEKEFDIELSPPYAAIESIIRNKYDSYAVFTWDQYTDLIAVLSDNKFVVLPLNEMRSTYVNSKVVVGLRHDIDNNPFKALEMAKIENMLGIRASYFILATGEYSGSFENGQLNRSKGLEALYRELYKQDAEIGIHNDLLTIMIQYNLDPLVFNKTELSYYGSLRIPIYGTASHGSPIARAIKVPNYQIFSDFAKEDSVTYLDKKYPLGKNSLRDYGFEYEAYAIEYNIYLSDSGGQWNDPEGWPGIKKIIESSIPGDRIQILVHPDWWGKKPKSK